MNQSGQFDVAVQKNVNDEEPANAAANPSSQFAGKSRARSSPKQG